MTDADGARSITLSTRIDDADAGRGTVEYVEDGVWIGEVRFDAGRIASRRGTLTLAMLRIVVATFRHERGRTGGGGTSAR